MFLSAYHNDKENEYYHKIIKSCLMFIELVRMINIMSTDKHRDIMMDVRTDSRPTKGECDSNIPPKLRFRGINVQLHPLC